MIREFFHDQRYIILFIYSINFLLYILNLDLLIVSKHKSLYKVKCIAKLKSQVSQVCIGLLQIRNNYFCGQSAAGFY